MKGAGHPGISAAPACLVSSALRQGGPIPIKGARRIVRDPLHVAPGAGFRNSNEDAGPFGRRRQRIGFARPYDLGSTDTSCGVAGRYSLAISV
jgi:hypothetical protein